MANDKVITTSALISKFQYALDNGWGYIYGTAGEVWTQAKQNAATREMTKKYGQKWVGHKVADCSGLFHWAFAQLGGYMYHGSDTMFKKYTTANGTLQSGKRTDGQGLKPGTAVFVYHAEENNYSHVGLFIGNGYVIEARGTQYGVVKTKITDKRWTHWGELKGVNYNGGDQPVPEGYAEVTGTRVALRSAPTTQADVITRVDEGNLVKIETPPPSEWEYVSFKDKVGYMMKKFLKVG